MVDWGLVAANLQEELDKRRWSAGTASAKAGIARGTVQKMLDGQEVRQHSLLSMERALGRGLDDTSDHSVTSQAGWICPDHQRHAVGSYYGIRQSYDDRSRFVSYFVNLYLNDGYFFFKEKQNNTDLNDHTFSWSFDGDVRCSGDIIQLSCDDDNISRVCTFQSGALKTIGEMSGYILTTNFDSRGTFPVISPALLFREDEKINENEVIDRLGVYNRDSFWNEKQMNRFSRLLEDFKKEIIPT